MKRGRILFLFLIFCLVFFLLNTNRNNVQASSFLSNDNITHVTLKVLSCEEKETNEEKCPKKNSNKDKPYKKLLPIVLSRSSNYSNNFFLEFINSLWKIFLASPEFK